ncbi:uncharacterized protein [Diadema antillarum]|uniref:uncharacterized protein n=2 Tax=Diadema antillarum TaxID=105358 RepID=UPI003A891478
MRHLVLGSILALLATIAEAAVYLNPPNITYAEGQTAYLRCSVTGISSPSFTWHHYTYPNHQSYYLFTSGNKRYSSATNNYWNKLHVRESGSDSLLIITDLKIFNSGIYTCVVSNQPAHATLKVERKSNMTLTVPSRVSPNQPITARCFTMAAIPVETLSWYLDGVLLSEGVTSQTKLIKLFDDIEDVSSKWKRENKSTSDSGLPIREYFNNWLALTGCVDAGSWYGYCNHNTDSTLTFTPTPADNGKILQCRVSGHEFAEFNQYREYKLDVRYPPSTSGVISVRIHDEWSDGQPGTVTITCHVSPEDEPNPYLNAYVINADSVPLHMVNSTSAVLPSYPNRCINVTCNGTSELGWTATEERLCPKAPPRNDTLRLETQDQIEDGYIIGVSVMCRSTEEANPPIHTYLIQAGGTSVPLDESASVTIQSNPGRCMIVRCIADNGIGRVEAVREHCPPPVAMTTPAAIQQTSPCVTENPIPTTIIARFDPVVGVFGQSTTTVGLLIVVLLLSIAVNIVVVMKKRSCSPPRADRMSWRVNWKKT